MKMIDVWLLWVDLHHCLPPDPWWPLTVGAVVFLYSPFLYFSTTCRTVPEAPVIISIPAADKALNALGPTLPVITVFAPLSCDCLCCLDTCSAGCFCSAIRNSVELHIFWVYDYEICASAKSWDLSQHLNYLLLH